MAAIKSIQRGTATIGVDTASTTASVTAVDLTKTVLFFGLSKAQDVQPRRNLFRGKFNSTTEIEFGRDAALGSATTIEWYVVEWTSGVTVQSGENTSSVDTTITAVVIADSFVGNTCRIGGSTLDAASLCKAWLSTTTNLRMEDDDTTLTASFVMNWFVVESTDFTVQAGSIALTGTTADQTITAVTLNQTFPIMSQSTASSVETDDVKIRGHFTSTTVERFEREVSDGPDQDIRWQVVDIGNGSSVQSGTFAFANADGQESATVTAVTNGLPVASGFMMRGGEAAGNGFDSPSGGEVTLDLTTSTNLQADRGMTDGTADIEWFLIDWNAAADTRFIRSNLVSRKPLKKNADRLASTGLISAGKST